jgi:hypothetical protein
LTVERAPAGATTNAARDSNHHWTSDALPLGDVIAVNLDHYRLHADYRHGVQFAALPTAWVSGFDKAATSRIGSSTARVTDTPGASAGFLDYTGQGLTTIERAMDCDERPRPTRPSPLG